mmetsp:Transcript_12416/g.23968  ORF Transcript_12416/g.23968 Transcript_12416/m.23968 type:complete len:120 (+) Transcript_12416:494-853(+)
MATARRAPQRQQSRCVKRCRPSTSSGKQGAPFPPRKSFSISCSRSSTTRPSHTTAVRAPRSTSALAAFAIHGGVLVPRDNLEPEEFDKLQRPWDVMKLLLQQGVGNLYRKQLTEWRRWQ